MIENEQREALITYRLDQAKAAIKEAEILIQNEMLRAAANRIYYGMFYSVLALALKKEFETSKHAQLIGWFNKTYIKNEIIEREYGKMLKEAFEFRQHADYATFIELSPDDITDKFNEMKRFIERIEQMLSID